MLVAIQRAATRLYYRASGTPAVDCAAASGRMAPRWSGTIAALSDWRSRAALTHEEHAVSGKPIKLQSKSVQADICLGVMIVGIETLLAIGLVLVFF